MMGTAGRMQNAVRLDLVTQYRYLFPQIYLGLAVLYTLIIRGTPLRQEADFVVPIFLFSEPGFLGFFLVAAQVFFERDQRSLTAVMVTPLRVSEYLAAKAISIGLLATLAGSLVFASSAGVDYRLALLILPLFLTAATFTLLGLTVSLFYQEFLSFVFGSVVVVIGLELPFLTYFGVFHPAVFAWLPSHPALFSFANLMRTEPDMVTYIVYIAQLLVYTLLVFLWCRRVFRTRIKDRLEAE